MKATCKYIRYLNVGKYLGYDPETASVALSNAQKINTAKQTISSTAAAAQALANQTGGNIMGFTYE